MDSERHVALIDDDRTVLAILGDVLKAAGFKVSVFRSAENALASLWRTQVDLLVVDLLLPGMSGYDLACELRLRPHLASTPMIAMSALTWSEEQMREYSSFFETVLEKPVDVDELALLARALTRDQAPHIPVEPGPAPEAGPPVTGDARVRLEVRLQAGDYVNEYSRNLAFDGLFIRTYTPLPEGTPVEVALTLPFPGGRASLRGTVVRIVPVDSPEARISAPGMGLALFDVPRDLKIAMGAFLAGLRAASGVQPAPSAADSVVLMVGLDALLPQGSRTFLARSGMHALRVGTLAESLDLAARLAPQVAVVHEALLGDDAEERVQALKQAGAEAVFAVASGARARALAGVCEVIDANATPARLLEQISACLPVVRRATARVRCVARVAVERPEGTCQAALENISLGGLLMTTDEAFAPGERFSIELELPEKAGRVSGLVRAVRISRVSVESAALRIGVAFEKLGEDSPEALRRYIQARVTQERSVRHSGETPMPFPVPPEGTQPVVH